VRASIENVTNTISGGTQHGPVLEGRDFRDLHIETTVQVPAALAQLPSLEGSSSFLGLVIPPRSSSKRVTDQPQEARAEFDYVPQAEAVSAIHTRR
jgi:hypothetical protein